MQLERYPGNPVLLPNPFQAWESLNVFNAAVVHERGLFHMLYRAQGRDYRSAIGYAVSVDGYDWARLDKPVLRPGADDETRGVEDPRIVALDSAFYMTYTGYSVHGTRASLARSTNLIQWEPLGVVLPDEDNKDHALFPARIGGRYCMFHRREPDIWLAYSDDLLHWNDHQRVFGPRPGWDSSKVGISGPPLRTPEGWLLVYHGVDADMIYRQGIALLDLDDPSRVLSRPAPWILEPQEPWEHVGDVPHVVFSCATLQVGDELWIYYGGADRVIGQASCPMPEAMAFLRTG
ncbi:MAG: glycosidase [Anaerolineae bacterium]|nr:glycosidase [Anaerolineae bacterium]